MLVSRADIDVRLNTEVTPDLAKQMKPDVIIAALGARPVKPGIPGIDGANVVGAEEAYADPDRVGKKVVILGGGLVGLELSIFLGQSGRDVTVLELQDQLTVNPRSLHTTALNIQMEKYGVDVHLSTKVTKITDSGVSAAGPEGDLDYAADTVIYATGQAPLADEAIALHDCACEYYLIGDCVAPMTIMNATHTAFVTAYDVGVI
jgi:pyruvate/2-oxoglutarate dehydrogenase complex dihydrolipoamide dehydrogenase (E3) component